jgi:hypothetical protein
VKSFHLAACEKLPVFAMSNVDWNHTYTISPNKVLFGRFIENDDSEHSVEVFPALFWAVLERNIELINVPYLLVEHADDFTVRLALKFVLFF